MTKKIVLADVKKQRDSVNCPIYYKPFGKISPYLSYLALKLNITPNQATIAWGLIGILSCILLSFGGYWMLLAGILVYQLAILLDFMDGEMARTLRVKDVIRGTYLDFLFSSTLRGLLMLGLGIGLYNNSGDIIYFYLGIWTFIFLITDNLNKLKVYETLADAKKMDAILELQETKGDAGWKSNSILTLTKFYIIRLLTPNNPLSFMLFFILFDISQYYLILMSLIAPVLFLKNFIDIYTKLGKIK